MSGEKGLFGLGLVVAAELLLGTPEAAARNPTRAERVATATDCSVLFNAVENAQILKRLDDAAAERPQSAYAYGSLQTALHSCAPEVVVSYLLQNRSEALQRGAGVQIVEKRREMDGTESVRATYSHADFLVRNLNAVTRALYLQRKAEETGAQAGATRD
jgi:hypothetical protein